MVDLAVVRQRFEDVSVAVSALQGLANAAASGASRLNEGVAVSGFGYGVSSYCDFIGERMERLWSALSDVDSGMPLQTTKASEVSHAKLAQVPLEVGASA